MLITAINNPSNQIIPLLRISPRENFTLALIRMLLAALLIIAKI
jgi:hypothetical protein